MSRSPARSPLSLAALALSALLISPPPSRAQLPAQADEPAVATQGPRTRRGAAELLARLNLTPEQRAQIRDIRRRTDLEGRPLLQRLRRARRALDAAIYSDTADDAVVQERLREFTSAQADVARLRALTELRVRRVLTPEQLGVLRELRRRAQLAQRRRNARLRGAAAPASEQFDEASAPDAPPAPRPRRAGRQKP